MDEVEYFSCGIFVKCDLNRCAERIFHSMNNYPRFEQLKTLVWVMYAFRFSNIQLDSSSRCCREQ